MVFNSYIFIMVFLPLLLIIYWLLKGKEKNREAIIVLIIASLVFYGYSYPCGLLILLISLGINYLFAINILKGEKGAKIKMIACVIIDVSVLALYKYNGLLLPDIKLFKINAPGISFYTFCEIAFIVECYRGSIKSISLEEYGFLMTFFPKLIEGPIVRPDELISQKRGKDKLSAEEIYRGVYLFSLGLFKKVVIAEVLGKAVDYGFTNPDVLHTGEALVVILSYTLQLYYDFSGYTDMALSLASFFGFSLPDNFNSPYKAKNIIDFWKRWHISLTKFFTYYLYIPLGGNRKGKVRTYINFLIIFFVSGLWHGAGLQFIIWGLMHGVLYVLTKIVADKKKIESKNRFVNGIKVFLTFIYVNIAWVFFRAPSVKDAVRLFKSVGEMWFPRFNYGLAKCFNLDELWYVIKVLKLDGFNNSIYFLMFIILICLLVVVFLMPNAVEFTKKCRINLLSTAVIVVLLVWSILSFEGVATYLYVNF